MQIGLLTIEFHLPGCFSLKEKRGRLRGLRDRFGKISNLAVSETAHHDLHDSAQWCFLALGETKAQSEKLFASVLDHANHDLDAVVTRDQIEWL